MKIMRLRLAILAACGLAIAPGHAAAADYDDPSWPCVQRKVETLSFGLLWPHPVPETGLREEMAADASELIGALALRRVSLEQADALIAAFAERHGDLGADDLGAIFRAVFERIGRDRRAVMQGIERYSLRQIALSEAIGETRVEMAALMEAEEPDFDRVDRLEEKLDWDERIYRDRAQSLTYVCETPVILEKRAYAIAQSLLAHVPQ